MARQVLTGVATEIPVFFKGGGEDLFGVLTVPTGGTRGIGVIALTGGSFVPASNRNRLSVRLAATLAPLGYHVFRFDYHGVGESTGSVRQFVLDQPFVQDLEAAVSVMRGAGLRRLVCVGGCFGTRTILSGAERIPELEAVVLMAAPVRDSVEEDHQPLKVARDTSFWRLARLALRRQTLQALLSPVSAESKIRTRHMYKRTIFHKARLTLNRVVRPRRALDWDPNFLSPYFAHSFAHVVDRGVSVLMLYGANEGYYEDFMRVRNQLHPVFERPRAPLDVEILDRPVHGFTTLAVQDVVIEHTVAWLERIFRA